MTGNSGTPNLTPDAQPQETGKSLSLFELLKDLAGAAVALVTPLYIIGQGFLHGYFHLFGVHASDLNIGVYDTLLFSLVALRMIVSRWIWIVLVIALALAVGLTLKIRFVRKFFADLPGICVSLVGLVLLFTAVTHWAANAGRHYASLDMREEQTRLPLISVLLNADASEEKKQGCLNLKEQNFGLLAHSNGRYYLFEPLKGQTGTKLQGEHGPVNVYVVPDGEVRLARIQARSPERTFIH